MNVAVNVSIFARMGPIAVVVMRVVRLLSYVTAVSARPPVQPIGRSAGSRAWSSLLMLSTADNVIEHVMLDRVAKTAPAKRRRQVQGATPPQLVEHRPRSAAGRQAEAVTPARAVALDRAVAL